MRWLLPILYLFCAACASKKLVRDKDYDLAVGSFRGGYYDLALEKFPKKEEGGFITSVEKNWLRLWDGEPKQAELQKLVRSFDERKFISLSREAGYFFYQESEEGYIPAEHEVIVMHLVSATAFLREQKWEEAAVEARRAGFFLEGMFNENQPHFDDPALRLWLAGIWAAVGDWQQAQVDLRRANRIAKSKELEQLLEAPQPPASLQILFYGVSPDLRWESGRYTPVFTRTKLDPYRDYLALSKTDSVGFDTFPWYERHELRNSQLRDVLVKSNYMAQFLGLKTYTGVQRGSTKAVAYTGKLIGIAVGAAIIGATIYLAAQGGLNGEATTYGFIGGAAVGGAIYESAEKFDREVQKSIDETETKGLEDMRTYRFVRFMPAWIVACWKGDCGTNGKSRLIFQAPKSPTKVIFAHQP